MAGGKAVCVLGGIAFGIALEFALGWCNGKEEVGVLEGIAGSVVGVRLGVSFQLELQKA